MDQRELEAIRGLSTCAISNAVELFNVVPRNEGFMLPGIECRFPELGTMIGYAITAVISTAHPGRKRVEITDFWTEILKVPEPRVVVIHDSDIHIVGSFWGDVRSNIYRRLGCVGAVTDGAVRDLDEVRSIGFHFFSRCVAVSHAYNHLIEIGIPIEVGGLTVKPGDLIVGDKHGVISVPLDLARDVPKAAKLIEERERTIIDYCRSPDFTLEGLIERYRAPRPSWPPSR
jgi:4-hydroxy-4-methyl-2-oxoglutarate aldolase